MKDILIFGSSLIRPEDAEELSKQHGIGRIFGAGTDVRDVVAYLRKELPRRLPARR